MNDLIGNSGDYLTKFGRMKIESVTGKVEFKLHGTDVVIRVAYV